MQKTEAMDDGFKFDFAWFNEDIGRLWLSIFSGLRPEKILEIGSFEGKSASFLMQANSWCEDLDLHCIDTWRGGEEHGELAIDMSAVEKRFDHNVSLARKKAKNKTTLTKHKGYSHFFLAKLIAYGYGNYFDFIYIDASHQAPDVLSDAVMAFKLCRVGGVIGFDDYTWSGPFEGGKDLLREPKIAIDSFININWRKIEYIVSNNLQIYIRKIAD